MDENGRRLNLASEITAKINRGESFEQIVAGLPAALNGLIPCDRLAIAFLHADGQTLVLGPVHARGRVLLATGHRETLACGSLKKILDQRRTGILNDLPGHLKRNPDSLATQLLIQEGHKSSLTVPMFDAGSKLGVLWIASRKVGAYKSGHESFMRLIAGQLAIVLEKARLVGRLSAHREVRSRLKDENIQLREIMARAPELTGAVGESYPWRKVLHKIEMVAETDSSVLLLGETGTGKELLARGIHRLSLRKDKPFIAINCGALSRELIASELFGHERGAFTGAVQRKLGRMDLAQGGTLFLDEVAELHSEMQVKLLRVLQEREFERVGGTQTIKADVRVIAATHRNLERERSEGSFRDDLFFRLNVFPILVPPLRERKEDLAALLEFFLRRYSQKMNKQFDAIDPQTMAQCLLYHWPGNVRELENLVERSVILCRGPVFFMDPLLESEAIRPAESAVGLDDVIRLHLMKILKSTRGKIYGSDGAARALGLKPSTLQAKLKKLGIERREC